MAATSTTLEPAVLTERQAMQSDYVHAMALAAATLIATGCASGPARAPQDVPASLRPPAGQSLFLEALATGVQIYECLSKPALPTTYEWTFRAPEATLASRSGQSIGKHYAGPTWEAIDGSAVVGDVQARDPGPDPSAIPWLLLTAKSTTGAGVLSQTKTIQRLQTVGGIAPSPACGPANAKQVVRIPYSATYYFYRVAA